MPAASSRRNQQSQFPRKAFEARDLCPGLGMKGMQRCISFMIHHSFSAWAQLKKWQGFVLPYVKPCAFFVASI